MVNMLLHPLHHMEEGSQEEQEPQKESLRPIS